MSELSPWAWFLYNIVCFPLKLYIDHLMNKPRHSAHCRPDSPYRAPIPLSTLSRQLSSNLDDSNLEYERKSAQQLQSRFFRLPKEIRLQIYKCAIGGRILHIKLVVENKKREKGPYPRCHSCEYGEHHVNRSEWTDCSTGHDRPTSSLTPLLQTCRRVYTEATHILYSTSTFDFDDPNCLYLFLPSILPQSLSTIRSVRFTYTMPPRRSESLQEDYDTPWEVLLLLPGLRELRVKLLTWEFPNRTEYWTANEGRWLKPLKRFENLQVFEAFLQLLRTEPLPKGVDVGSCQLFAVDDYGTPYRDYDY